MKKPIAWCLVAAALASGCTIVIPNAQINAPVNANAKTTVGSVAVAPPSLAQEEQPAASPPPSFRPTEPPRPSEPSASPTTGVTDSEETLRNTGLASSLVALELMAAIATDAGAFFASQDTGNGIAVGEPNAAGIISNNAQGYIAFALKDGMETAPTGEKSLVGVRKDPSGRAAVQGNYTFERTQTPSGGLHYTLLFFQGEAKGFKVAVSGELDVARHGIRSPGILDGVVSSKLTGKLVLNDRDVFTLNELAFSASHPLPETLPGVGRMKIRSAQSGSSLNLKADLDRGVVQFEGTRTMGNGIITTSFEARDNSSPPSTSAAPNVVANPAWN